MNDLRLIKAFAELEGVELIKQFIPVTGEIVEFYSKETLTVYSPIDDYALNCVARDKYKVEIDYENLKCSIFGLLTWVTVDYFKESELNRAVIECILKSKGKNYEE